MMERLKAKSVKCKLTDSQLRFSIQLGCFEKCLKPGTSVHECMIKLNKCFNKFLTYSNEVCIFMDKKIRDIERQVGKTGKSLKSLEKMDKKRDVICEKGEKMMKKKKKK